MTFLNRDFGNRLATMAAAIGTDAKQTSYVTASGKAMGRDGLVVGLKYSF